MKTKLWLFDVAIGVLITVGLVALLFTLSGVDAGFDRRLAVMESRQEIMEREQKVLLGWVDKVDAYLRAVDKQVSEPVTVYQEKIIEVSTPVAIRVRDWESIEEVESVITNMLGGLTIFEPNACVDVTRNFQRVLVSEGYPVSIGFTDQGIYWGKKVTTTLPPHAILIINVKNDWYAVDLLPYQVTKFYEEKQ